MLNNYFLKKQDKERSFSLNRIIIAGTQSGAGKTTIAIGLMAALTDAGYEVQPFKVGPDYIDPGFHTKVTGNISRNLDSYFMDKNGVREIFCRQAQKADISIIEGVMGLFDGKGKKGIGSTAEIAKILKAPVILVINAKKMAQSGAALAYGFKNFDNDLNVKGVILNKIGSESHYQLVKSSIEENLNIKVAGYLPHNPELELPERHLGLVPAAESEGLTDFIEILKKDIKKHINLDQLMNLARENAQSESFAFNKNIFEQKEKFNVNIGIARDAAFNFYYQDSLDLLKALGGNLIPFSPISDKQLPDVDGIFIGGGFPESFLKELAANKSIKKDIYNFIDKGLPVYAECGGLMYLTENIYDQDDQKYPMVGMIPGDIVLENTLQAMGYVEVEAVADNILFNKGQKAKGHQFHYSRLTNLENTNYSYQVSKGRNPEKDNLAGFKYKNLLASFIHLHFGSNPRLVHNFLKSCKDPYGEKRI